MTTSSTSAPKLLLIHLPGADWRLIGPALDAGHLPHLEALITRGTVANLASGLPLRFPAATTSLATGRHAERHGALSPVIADEALAAVRPFHSGDIDAPFLWDLLRGAGLQAACVGWPGSYPVAADALASITDVFAMSRGKDFDSWTLDPKSLSPDLPADVLEELRLHQSEVTAEMLLPFVEAPSHIDLETDERMGLIASTLARTSTLHAVATWIAETQDWDCLAVHFDFMERLTTAFLPLTAPQMPQVTDTDFTVYQNVVSGAYRFFDLLLQRYVELVDDDCTIMLTSSHGYHLGNLRKAPGRAGHPFAAPMYRSLGIFAAAGPGIKEDALVFGPRTVDVVPTVLAALAAAPPAELDGKVMDDIFVDAPVSMATCNIPQKALTPKTLDPAYRDFQLKEWATVGLMAQLPYDTELALETTNITTALSRADAFMARFDFTSALESLDVVRAISPDHPGALLKSAQCHLALKQDDQGTAMLDDLEASGFRAPTCDYLRGQAALQRRDKLAAAQYFSAAETSGQLPITLMNNVGRGWLALKEFERAERLFRASLDIDEDDPLACGGLGKALHGLKRYGEAVDAFKRSLGVLQHQPDIHSFLGHAYFWLGDHAAAAEAYHSALAIAPNYPMAVEGLERLGHAIARTAKEAAS